MNLVTALRTAAAVLNGRAAISLHDGPYDDSRDLAGFLAVAAGEIEKGNLAAVPELQRIFAPTSDWDDAGGRPYLSQAIFDMLRTPAAQPPSAHRWNVDRDRLKLAVEGDKDGLRVPLPFHDRTQFLRFAADLEDTLLSEGITDAAVLQIGPGTSGWSGNSHRYLDYMSRGGTEQGWFEYGTWKPGSDTEFVIFSDQALVQAMQVMEEDPQIDRQHRLFMNGEAPTQANPAGRPGFAHAPLGAKLLALALRWNQELYGSPNPPAGGFDFLLNLDIDLKRYSRAVTVYRGPEADERERRRAAEKG